MGSISRVSVVVSMLFIWVMILWMMGWRNIMDRRLMFFCLVAASSGVVVSLGFILSVLSIS